ncbi:MAG: LysR family transcriptional regulator [Candidatus Borkfalkiaceae bacterium]|nr:LysR family transcriptional regulator [Clostridia bacterium]MDY6224053.1 LysR family transcriptional regulator [Christensenellaceae bacterium]
MNIGYLKYAIVVAKAGSLSKAAEELSVAQPNLSRAIKELEKELDIIIFERKPKGIVLTPDGEILISYGKRILKEIDDVEKEFKERGKEKAVFSASVPRATYVSHAFAEFSKTLSEKERCEVYYKETNALRAITNILEKDYRLGIIRYAAIHDKEVKDLLKNKNLAFELIAEFRYVLVMSKDSPLAAADEIHYSDLGNYIEIAHADPYVPSVSLSQIREEELPDTMARRIFVFERASQFDVLSANKETFMWVSRIPPETLQRYNLVCRECSDNAKLYRDVLIYSKNYTLTSLDKSFITCLCESKRRYFD